MRPIKFLSLAIFIFFLASCGKDNIEDITPIEAVVEVGKFEKYYKSEETPNQINKRDRTIENELRDIFEEYIGRGVITSEFIAQTGYPVWSLSNEIIADNSTVVVLPTSIPESCQTSGIWYYYSSIDDQRIHYVEKSSFSNRIENENVISAYPANTSFTAASFVQLQSQLCDIILDDLNQVYVVTRGGDEENEEDEHPCIGGEFVDVRVWVYDPTSDGTNLQHINTVMDAIRDLKAANFEIFGTLNIDGSSFSELDSHIDDFLSWNSGIWGAESVLQEYKELRQELSNLGIGNGSSGILEGAGNRGGEKFWTSETIKVWVFCWEDPLDFGLSSGQGSGGGSTSVIPNFWPDMQELQECIGVNDTYDIDLQSGGNETASFTGDVEMCTLWNKYKAECLAADFEGVTASSYFTPYEHQHSPYSVWGQLKHDNPELFNEIINNMHGCVITEDIADNSTTDDDDEKCLKNAITDFELEHDITLSDEEVAMVLSDVDCDSEFTNSVFHIINCVTKSNDYIIIGGENIKCAEAGFSMSEDCKKLDNLLNATIGPDGAIPICGLMQSLGTTIVDIRYFWDCTNSSIDPRPIDNTYPDAQT